MKIKKGFILKENMMGKDNPVGIVISVDSSVNNLNGYISLNETGIFIWKMLEKGATIDEIVLAIVNEYDAPVEIVKNDVEMIVSKIKEIGAIDD